jgi:hypothetical protein
MYLLIGVLHNIKKHQNLNWKGLMKNPAADPLKKRVLLEKVLPQNISTAEGATASIEERRN